MRWDTNIPEAAQPRPLRQREAAGQFRFGLGVEVPSQACEVVCLKCTRIRVSRRQGQTFLGTRGHVLPSRAQVRYSATQDVTDAQWLTSYAWKSQNAPAGSLSAMRNSRAPPWPAWPGHRADILDAGSKS